MSANIAVHLIFSFLIVFTSCEHLWHSYQFGSGYGNREELVITHVAVDETFKSGKGVKFWKSVPMGPKSYGVGLMDCGFTVAAASLSENKEGVDVQTNIVEFQMNLTNMELFKISQDIVLITSSSDSQLRWYNLTGLEVEKEMWSWPLPIRNISYIHYTRMYDKNNLLIINNDQSKSEVLVYEFDGPKLWLTQVLPLASPAENLAVSEFGADIFLSIPQHIQNMVQIYRLKQDHFVPYQNLTTVNVSQVQTFKIGFKPYLAINGHAPGIYRFAKEGIVLESHGIHLDGVEFWLPVPVKTYRDEVVLLAQRLVDHGPHKSMLIEAFVFNGETFIQHEEMPCYLYGVTENGLSCMVDEEGERSLMGSAVLTMDKLLGVLIPRPKSRLFILNITLKVLNSPVEMEIAKLKETKEKIQKTMDYQQNKFKSIQASYQKQNDAFKTSWAEQLNPKDAEVILGHPREQQIDLQAIDDDLDKTNMAIQNTITGLRGTTLLNATELNFDQLVLNGELEVEGPISFHNVSVTTLNDEIVPDVFNDLVRKFNVGPIKARKTFTDIDIHDLTFQYLHGHNASDVVYNAVNKTIVFNGDLIFDNRVEVLADVNVNNSQVNGYNMEDEVVQMGKKYPGTLNFTSVKLEGVPFAVDTITIAGNLSVTNINDENMEAIKRSICLTNIDNHIPGDTILSGGDLTVDGELSIKYLNGLKFPEEYVVRNSPPSIIKGEKIFESDLKIQRLIVEDKINNVDPGSMVTLNNDQELVGSYVFNDLEVTESLGFNDVSGPHVGEFLENPILTQTQEIKAAVNFKSLEVDGAIIITGVFNESDFAGLLEDVIYADEDRTLITSIKSFPRGMSVTNGIEVHSNAINTTPLDHFITIDTEQTLIIQTWNGDVQFTNLQILGLYGGINITQLNEETVKLTGEQFVSSTLIFELNDESIADLSATELIITNTLNGIPLDHYSFTTGESRTLTYDAVVFESLQADHVIVDGELIGYLNNFSIEEFDLRRVSLTKDQIFTADYVVDYMEAVKVEAQYVNGVLYKHLFDIEFYSDLVSKMLFDGKLKITNLHVNGSISALTMNDMDLGILQRCFWTNKNNYFKTAVFKGDVFLKSLSIDNFNSVNFKEFSNNIVLKHEKDLTIHGFKTFINGFHVVKYINSERLNNILVDDILTKSGSHELLGPLNIYGDVTIYEAEIHEAINEVAMEYLTKTFEFVGNTLIIKDDMVFNRLAYVKRLWIDGAVQDYNVTEFLEGILYPDQNYQVPGAVVFEAPVHAKSNVIIQGTFNSINLLEFMEEVVFITEPDTIEASVIFNQYVHIQNELLVSSNLESRLLYGIDLENWKNAAFVNEGLIPGSVSFESATIHGEAYIKYINDIDVSALVPLRTEQVILGKMMFSEIKPFHDVVVNGLFNGNKLIDLYSNSVFMNGQSQRITSPITFTGNVLIRDHLHITGLMNGKNFSDVITTDTDQTITTKLTFKELVTLDSDLFVTSDTINNINITNWRQKSVLLASKPQEIYNRWMVDGDVTFKENVDGTGLIGGMDVRQMAEDVEAKRFYKSTTEKNLAEGYMNMCKDVNMFIEKAQNQIYLFKYFESLKPLTFGGAVKVVHSFHYQQQTYFLTTEEDSCTGILFIWNKTNFVVINRFNVGGFDHLISVYDGDLIFIISNTLSTTCEYSGTNVWRFSAPNLMPLFKLEDHRLIQESFEPGTFYGLLKNELIEYKLQTIVETIVKRYRKWNLDTTDYVAFVPRGMGTGLALYNDRILMKLVREESNTNDDQYGYQTNTCLVGKIITTYNHILPVLSNNNIVVINIGTKGKRRSLLAVATHEETSVKGRLDFIKIYENIHTGKLFHKVPAYKPSSLVSVEFGNSGETLLLFLEDKKVLQIYEYKGIEGFQQRTSVNIQGSKLVNIAVPTIAGQEDAEVVGVIDNNQIYLLLAEMDGNQLVTNKIDCDL